MKLEEVSMTTQNTPRSSFFRSAALMPFILFLFFFVPWSPHVSGSGAAQEKPVSATGLIDRALEKWRQNETVEYDVKSVLAGSGREKVTFSGMSIIQGSRSRTSLTTGGLGILLVKDGEHCWNMVMPSGFAGARSTFKAPRDLYLEAVHPLTRMIHSGASVHDPLDPGTILSVLLDCYDLEYKGTTEWNSLPTYRIEGLLKKKLLNRKTLGAGQEDSQVRPFSIRKMRLLLSKDSLVPARVDFFESTPYRASCSLFFSRVKTGIAAKDEVFRFEPSAQGQVHDLEERYRKLADRSASRSSGQGDQAERSRLSAHEILERAREKWDGLGNAGFDFKLTFFTGEMPVDITGRIVVQGELGRFEAKMELMKIRTVMVNDGRFFWTEIVSPFDPGKVMVYKRSSEKVSGREPDFNQGLGGFLAEPAGVPDPIDMIEILFEDFDLEYTGTTEWQGNSVHLVTAEPARGSESGEEDLPIGPARILFHEESLLLAGIEILGTTSEGLFCSLVILDLETDWRIPDGTFHYEAPEGAVLVDVDEEFRKALRIPPDCDKPALPLSRKACFDKVSEDRRLELIIAGDGTVSGYRSTSLTGNLLSRAPMRHNVEKFSDIDELRSLFSYASEIHGTLMEVVGGRTFESDDVDLVIYASAEAPCLHLQGILETARSYGSNIRRIHLAAQDEETGEEGLLTFHLPHTIGIAGPEEEHRNLANWYRVHMKASENGPEYALSDARSDDEEWAFETLDSLAQAIDAVKKENKRAGFVPWLDFSYRPYPAVTMKHFVDLITLLQSKGVDLKWEKYGYICVYPGRVEQLPDSEIAGTGSRLPLSDKAAFKTVPGDPEILQITFDKDGTVLSGGKRFNGPERIRSLLYFSAKRSRKEDDGCSNLNIFFHAPRDLPLRHLIHFILVCCQEDIKIYKLYLIVRDPKAKKNGVIPFFLPRDVGVNSLPMEPEELALLHTVIFTGYPDGPHYELCRVLDAHSTEAFDTLSDLENRIDTLKEKNPKTSFTFALGGFPLDPGPPGSSIVCVEDLAALLTSLSLRDVDLEAKKSNFYIEEEIIEDG